VRCLALKKGNHVGVLFFNLVSLILFCIEKMEEKPSEGYCHSSYPSFVLIDFATDWQSVRHGKLQFGQQRNSATKSQAEY
jgi:hypothetical protein